MDVAARPSHKEIVAFVLASIHWIWYFVKQVTWGDLDKGVFIAGLDTSGHPSTSTWSRIIKNRDRKRERVAPA